MDQNKIQLNSFDKVESIADINIGRRIVPAGTVATVGEWCRTVGRVVDVIDLNKGSDTKWWKFHSYNNIIREQIKDGNIINTYRFGSIAYGTYNLHSDKLSDIDTILVVSELFDAVDVNIHVYTIEQFQRLLDNHDIQMLECYFARYNNKTVHHQFKFTLDKQKLRTAISTITSNSWVKGKKKLIVAGDYDLWLGIKSVFHSLRILDYGMQIAEHGRIINFESMSYVLKDLLKMSELNQRIELWNAIETKYKPMFNKMNTAFKLLAPKDLTEKDRKVQLEKVLAKYNVENQELVNEILQIF